MDDDLLRARLRAVEGDAEPRREFVDALHDQVAARLGLVEGGVVPAPRVVHHGRRSTMRRLLAIAAVLALLVLASANLAAIGSFVERLFHQPSLLETIETTGRLRIAIRPDGPQSAPATGAIQGFDVDVARAIAGRLAVGDELVVASLDEMLAVDAPDWQVALPSRALPATGSQRYLATSPYYAWPVLVVVATAGASGPAGLARLDGATACVVGGSPGEAWLAGWPEASGLEVLAAAPAMTAVVRRSDAECFAELASGGASAIVTEQQLASDIATRGGVAIAGEGPVAREWRSILISASARGAPALRDRLDALLDGLRRDGTLGELSRRRFGGEDLTGPAE